jgi:hypothetical protein
MGANIGTTITGQLIALDIGAIAPLIAFLGVACIMFIKSERIRHIASIFAGDFENYIFPSIFTPCYSSGIYEHDLSRREIVCGGFRRENGEIFAYWNPTNIMTTSYEGTITFEIYSKYNRVRLIDVMDGTIYEIPESIVRRDEFGMFKFAHLPIKDTPMLLEFGEFIEE